ncbi:hypothetical protein BJY04DRAFT_213786 [Aspergillus karnatakaensis]|uniref:uncharacterized protein n=1 Tax=Aspergillus karnatakaensis TaxID=1810916 RepID=UPI003CCC9BE1
MRLTPTLLSLTLLTLTTSTPLNPTFTLPHPTPMTKPHSVKPITASLPQSRPTLPPTQTAKASSLTHQIATILAENAAESYDESTCPLSHKSKQCCTSVNGLADDLMGQVGGILPWASGISVSSLVGFQCKAMAATAPNVDCLDSVMCCSANGGVKSSTKADVAEKPGSQSLFKSGCIPYDKAIADKKEAIEKSKVQASMLAAEEAGSASGSASATATASGPSETGSATGTAAATGVSRATGTGLVGASTMATVASAARGA